MSRAYCCRWILLLLLLLLLLTMLNHCHFVLARLPPCHRTQIQWDLCCRWDTLVFGSGTIPNSPWVAPNEGYDRTFSKLRSRTLPPFSRQSPSRRVSIFGRRPFWSLLLILLVPWWVRKLYTMARRKKIRNAPPCSVVPWGDDCWYCRLGPKIKNGKATKESMQAIS